MDEFVVPAFLQDSGTDKIHQRMLSHIPDYMDKTEGGVPWDLTYPSALEISETVEFVILEAIKSMFPMWASGTILDYHGQNRGMKRKQAAKATGSVTFHGTAGYTIPAGTVLSTTSEDGSATVLFVTVEDCLLNEEGVAEAAVEAVEAGTSGNVAVGRINRLDKSDSKVLSLENAEATSGGLDMEDDEPYGERQVEYDQTQGESFIGSYADYKRWALSVNGVGGAAVIPAKDDSGEVRISITDVYGNPASESLCEDVYNYIMQPENPYERLAPINAILKVVSIDTIEVEISATIETDGIRSLESIKADFMDKLKAYYLIAVEDQEVKYSKIGSMLVETNGVYDYSNLLVNGGTSNIPVESGYVPKSDDSSVALTIG